MFIYFIIYSCSENKEEKFVLNSSHFYLSHRYFICLLKNMDILCIQSISTSYRDFWFNLFENCYFSNVSNVSNVFRSRPREWNEENLF